MPGFVAAGKGKSVRCEFEGEKKSLKEGRGAQPRELHKEEVLGVGIDS